MLQILIWTKCLLLLKGFKIYGIQFSFCTIGVSVLFFTLIIQWKISFLTMHIQCIELNVHAPLIFLITIRDHFEGKAAMFTPWLLGSQSCEKVFRSARSTINTFSAMINFSMFGLLQSLHRLQIQSNLQAPSQSTGVVYPQINKHSCEDGNQRTHQLVQKQIYSMVVVRLLLYSYQNGIMHTRYTYTSNLSFSNFSKILIFFHQLLFFN